MSQDHVLREVAESTVDAVVSRLSLAEKIHLVDGRSGFPVGEDGRMLHEVVGHPVESLPQPGAVGADGYVPALPGHGIPALHLCGAGVGLTDMYNQRPGDGGATVFPSALGVTASWDPELTRAFGRAVAAEARAVGINVMLAGACNLAAEPWCGRLFEYHGEDPLLSGTMVAGEIRGTQEAGVLASLKHYAANFCETGRFFIDTVVDERLLRHTELRVFETALELCDPAAVMAAYNKVNGSYACEQAELLDRILKQEWGFDGWVMSDWGAMRSTVPAALAGLDQEFPLGQYYSDDLAAAVAAGEVPEARLDDMCRRILRWALRLPSEDRVPTDVAAALATAELLARRSITLLSNDGILPLPDERAGSLLLVGLHADRAVISGGGSATVRPRFGDPVNDPDVPVNPFRTVTWVPSSPLDALREALPSWRVEHRDPDADDLEDRAAAADVVVVMAYQHSCEGSDHASLSLPDDQDDLVTRLAAVQPRLVVVLQTGGPVLLPWRDRVAAILELWYPGHRGGEALAAVLTGAENPSGKLPVTFPASADQPQHPGPPTVPVRPGRERPAQVPPHGDHSWVDQPFEMTYDQPLGHQWYDARDLQPAYCFGHGLSYTTFGVTGLELRQSDRGLTVTVTVTNTGSVPGREVVQAYATLPPSAGEPPRRLVAWAGIDLLPGESRRTSMSVPWQDIAVWDVAAQRWHVEPGPHTIAAGSSSRELPVSAVVDLPHRPVASLAERRRARSHRPDPTTTDPDDE